MQYNTYKAGYTVQFPIAVKGLSFNWRKLIYNSKSTLTWLEITCQTSLNLKCALKLSNVDMCKISFFMLHFPKEN